MDLGSISSLIMTIMRVCENRINSTDLEPYVIKIKVNLREIFIKEKKMELEQINKKMEQYLKKNTKKEI